MLTGVFYNRSLDHESSRKNPTRVKYIGIIPHVIQSHCTHRASLFMSGIARHLMTALENGMLNPDIIRCYAVEGNSRLDKGFNPLVVSGQLCKSYLYWTH